MSITSEPANQSGTERSARARALIAKIVDADGTPRRGGVRRRARSGGDVPFRECAADRRPRRCPADGRGVFLGDNRLEAYDSWESADALVYEGVVHYTFGDGSNIALPYANVLRLAGDRVADYRIYIDPAPLTSTPLGAVLSSDAQTSQAHR